MERTGVCWRAIATDGKRLEVAGPIDADSGVAVIVPTRLARTLVSVFCDCDDGVIGCNDSTIAIAGGGWTVAGRLLEGLFPQWRKVIPSLPHQIDIDAHAIREVIARVQVCSGEATRIDLEIGDGTLTAKGYDETSAAEAETVVESGAAPLKTTLAAEFLLDAIAESIGTIAIHYGTAEQAVVIYDADVVAVIMPMTGGEA
jgi:DNA polymerase-3 subunit beta